MSAVQVFDTYAEGKPALSLAVPTLPFAPYPTSATYYLPYPHPPPVHLHSYDTSWNDEPPQPWLSEGPGRLARADSRATNGLDVGGPVARTSYGAPADWGHYRSRPTSAREASVDHTKGRLLSPAEAWALGGARAPPPPPPAAQTLAHLASYANANFYEDAYRNQIDEAGPSSAFYPPGASERARSTAGTTSSENAPDEPVAPPRAVPEVAARKTRRPRKPRRRADEEPRDFAHRRYICELCGPDGAKTFARPSALSLHMLTHSKVKSHICPTCSRAFSISSNLRRHQKLHERDAAVPKA